jgi:hypothetical protein
MLRLVPQSISAFLASCGISYVFYVLPNFPQKTLVLTLLVGPIVEEICKFSSLRKTSQDDFSWPSLVNFGFIFFFLEFLLKFFVFFRNLTPSVYEFLTIIVPLFALIMVVHVSCALFYLSNRRDIAFFKALAFHAGANFLAFESHNSSVLGEFRFLLPMLIALVLATMIFWPQRSERYAGPQF